MRTPIYGEFNEYISIKFLISFNCIQLSGDKNQIKITSKILWNAVIVYNLPILHTIKDFLIFH